MSKEPKENGEKRDNKGRFTQGNTYGPGRPEGSVSIVGELRKKLLEVPEGQKITYLEALTRKILKKAITDEDVNMIKDLINRMDGMPKQSIEHSGEIKQGKIEIGDDEKAIIEKLVEARKKKIK